VPILFKQWDEWLPWPHFNDANIDDEPGQSRYDACIWLHGEWNHFGKPMWCDAKDLYGGCGARAPRTMIRSWARRRESGWPPARRQHA
jgi:hypothetical protein